MNIIAGKQHFESFAELFLWVVYEPQDHTYTILPDGIPDLRVEDLTAEGDIEINGMVTLTDVRHKSSGRPVEISALDIGMRAALEQRVFDELQGDGK